MPDTDWRTVGVSALAPEAATAIAAIDPDVIHSWYWIFDEMLASTDRDGRGDLYEFVPVALLHQERALPEGEEGEKVRVVPGKLTLMGTVVPVDDQEPQRPSDAEEERWSTVSVSYLPDGIRTVRATGALSTRLNSLLLQRHADGPSTRVKLGRFDSGKVVPISNYTRGFDLGPWEFKRET
ncbi:hypothetical protein [Mycobacteroides abscessus]|uniref:hypothetical protein n=1 Tax=Mycobacteroides abscessus TaxID=36809 RepID=UPI001054ECB0|nr:hypothetical protein [Mycobacteroides abscessus]